MVLPYFLTNEILPTFEEMLQTTTSTEQLQVFVAYMEKQWLQNPNYAQDLEHLQKNRPGGMPPPRKSCFTHREAAVLPSGPTQARGEDHRHHCEADVQPQGEPD